jgi:hypothetical protein
MSLLNCATRLLGDRHLGMLLLMTLRRAAWIAFPKPFAPFREVELTEFEPPTRIRWAERSKNIVTAADGGYDLAPQGRTKLTIHNVP